MGKSLRDTLLGLLICDLKALQMRIHKFVQSCLGFWPDPPATSEARHDLGVLCCKLTKIRRAHARLGQKRLNLGKQFGMMSVFHAA